MKKISLAAIAAALAFQACLSAVYAAEPKSDAVFQASTLSALFSGNLDGYLSLKELKQKGDTGIGTFTGLDGEMVMADGRIFRVDVNGNVSEMPDGSGTPFAMATYFDRDITRALTSPASLEGLQSLIKSVMPSEDVVYAIKVEGLFSSLEVRSVPGQEKPYKGLAEAVKNQKIFNLKDVKGTMVGFWMPSVCGGINNPGFHFHFISDDHKAGGHVLDCGLEKGMLYLDEISGIDVKLVKGTGPAAVECENP